VPKPGGGNSRAPRPRITPKRTTAQRLPSTAKRPSARPPSRRCLTGSCGLRGCRRRLGKVSGDRTAGGLSHLARSTRAGPFAHPDAEISSFYSRGGVAFGALARTRGNRSRDLSSADHSAARALGQLRRSHGRTWPWSSVAHRCRLSRRCRRPFATRGIRLTARAWLASPSGLQRHERMIEALRARRGTTRRRGHARCLGSRSDCSALTRKTSWVPLISRLLPLPWPLRSRHQRSPKAAPQHHRSRRPRRQIRRSGAIPIEASTGVGSVSWAWRAWSVFAGNRVLVTARCARRLNVRRPWTRCSRVFSVRHTGLDRRRTYQRGSRGARNSGLAAARSSGTSPRMDHPVDG
jgi:hypothetical protein